MAVLHPPPCCPLQFQPACLAAQHKKESKRERARIEVHLLCSGNRLPSMSPKEEGSVDDFRSSYNIQMVSGYECPLGWGYLAQEG